MSQSVSQFYTTPSPGRRLTRSRPSPDERVFLSSRQVMDILKRPSPQQHKPDALRIVEIDDIKGEGADLLTDGCGYISADLADAIPPTAHGRCVSWRVETTPTCSATA